MNSPDSNFLTPFDLCLFGKHLVNSLNECVRPLSISAFLWKDLNKKWNIFKTQRRLSGPAELEIAAFEKQKPWKRKKEIPPGNLFVWAVERKRRIGSCLESTQKCYCQSAEVSAGKSYRCNRLSTKFHKNFQQLINSWSAQLLRGGSNTKVDRVHKYETSSDCCPCRAIIFPPFYSAKMYRHRIAD